MVKNKFSTCPENPRNEKKRKRKRKRMVEKKIQ